MDDQKVLEAAREVAQWEADVRARQEAAEVLDVEAGAAWARLEEAAEALNAAKAVLLTAACAAEVQTPALHDAYYEAHAGGGWKAKCRSCDWSRGCLAETEATYFVVEHNRKHSEVQP